MGDFEVSGEFVCPGCCQPFSRLAADHALHLDDSGATICSNGVKPMTFYVQTMSAGGTDSGFRLVGGLCATCGKRVPGGGHRDGCTGLVPGSEFEIA